MKIKLLNILTLTFVTVAASESQQSAYSHYHKADDAYWKQDFVSARRFYTDFLNNPYSQNFPNELAHAQNHLAEMLYYGQGGAPHHRLSRNLYMAFLNNPSAINLLPDKALARLHLGDMAYHPQHENPNLDAARLWYNAFINDPLFDLNSDEYDEIEAFRAGVDLHAAQRALNEINEQLRLRAAFVIAPAA